MIAPLCVVLPLDSRREPQHGDNPWETVARGEGITIRYSDQPQSTRKTWRMPLGPTSALSRHLQAVAPMLGGGRGATQLFRVEFPPGFNAGDLMPAVGGGFRGVVRSGNGAHRIDGQARLIPGPAGLRTAALGPMLGLMAVTILTEMAAAAEQDRKLTAILTTVERVDARLRLESDARLQTAEQTIRQAHAALLDRAAIPESVGLGAAMSHVQDIRNLSSVLIAGWERVLERQKRTEVPGSVLRKELGEVGKIGWDGFTDAVRTAHLANHLDSRRLVLVAAEAQFRNPGSPLHHLRQAVEADLAERARDLDRLRTVLARLSSTPLTISAWDAGMLPHLITDRAAENARTQALFAGLSAAMTGAADPAWCSTGFDAELGVDGDVRILEPGDQRDHE
ncbi:hypothetical protein ACQPZQ_34330 [Pseudonocardia sp. CA-142604]|uniref:hypothetical protein n=1 Tax=Pseudonocardia sp. CA-142604 TaxID=3240024 RepID=UPI003D8C023E